MGQLITKYASALNPKTVNGLNLYVYAYNNPISYGVKSTGIIIAGSHAGINLNSHIFLENSDRVVLTISDWIAPLSTGIDHAISMINSVRSAIAVWKYDNLWELMKFDGITELPGTMSKIALEISYGLGVIEGLIAGYEKYSAGASFFSSTMTALVNIKYNIGITAASSASAAAIVGYLAASTTIPGGILIVGGAVVAILIGEFLEWTLTELPLFGKTYQEREKDYYDWLIFWD